MKAFLLLTAMATCLPAVYAQQAVAPVAQKPDESVEDPGTRIILDVTRVNMLFTVTDKKGRFVTDLTKDDFEVFENKKPQTIPEFTAETDLPLRLAHPDRYQQQHPRALPLRAGSRRFASLTAWSGRAATKPWW